LGGLIVIDFIDMEDTKNQRAVENRLRDALHFDRARVQMGKISRFGLMELSRQRLRPALNEGSHITCPRCNGTGVIRDAESSALQVLRLLQEEAMKENTAAVHAQVPVDVATFLLNEKRSDITKIETRLKVNLILIPNRHLETPHHHIERLRHDDPRLEDIKTSFDLVDAPSTDMSWAPKEQEIKAKPEALVKGITPAQPAPVSSTPAKKADANATPGLFSRFFSWLTGSSEKKEEATKPTDTRERGRSAQGDRRGGNRGGRGRRPDNRGEGRSATNESATTPDNRRAPKADERSDRAPQTRTESGELGEDNARGNRNRRGRGRNRREDGSEVRADQADGVATTNLTPNDNAAPNERRPQAARPSPTSSSLSDDQANLQNGLEAQGLGEDDIDQNDPERKRRRRRSRRGRRGSDEGSNQDGREDQASEGAGFDHVSSNALSGAPVNYVEHGSTPVSTPAAIDTPVSTPVVSTPVVSAPVVAAPVVAAPVVAAPVVAAPVVTAPAPAAFVQTETAPVVSAPVVSAPVQVAPAAVQPTPTPAPASVQVAATPSAPIAAPAAPADTATLHAIVQTAGLQWVESDPVRVAQAMANQRVTPIKLGREPKPRVAVSSEPLVQVETSR
ncbi:ribonuclease E/G, partial [Zwartia sp.]